MRNATYPFFSESPYRHLGGTIIKTRLLGSVFAVILTGTAQAEESYLCVTDLKTGFTYEKDSDWRQANFKAHQKYIVRKPGDDYIGLFVWSAFIVIPVGQKFASYGCENGFNDFVNLFCRGSGSFNMNKKTLSFISTHDFGYMEFEEGQEEGVDDVSISIGKCSSF